MFQSCAMLHNDSYLAQALYQVLGTYNKTTTVFLKALEVYFTVSVSNREALEQWATLGLREPKAFRSVTSNQPSSSIFFTFSNLAGSSLLVCVFVWYTPGDKRSPGGSRASRSNRNPWRVWRKGEFDACASILNASQGLNIIQCNSCNFLVIKTMHSHDYC